jgi:hypothetical protein
MKCVLFLSKTCRLYYPLMPNDIILNSLVQYIYLSSCYFLSSGSNFVRKSSHVNRFYFQVEGTGADQLCF